MTAASAQDSAKRRSKRPPSTVNTFQCADGGERSLPHSSSSSPPAATVRHRALSLERAAGTSTLYQTMRPSCIPITCTLMQMVALTARRSASRAPMRGSRRPAPQSPSPPTRIAFRPSSIIAARSRACPTARGSRQRRGAATKEKDDNCYRPHGATCPNQCEVLVEIDGVRTSVAHTNLVGQALTHDHKNRDFQGEVKVILMDQGAATTTHTTHTYTLTMPWGAPVALRRVHLEHPDGR